ncbi:MAG: metallophosphoesterase [Gammaproteobacteria bacterium]|nr:metallophosphoesterase [Gammaproteobacteria bacterium]
MNTGTEPLQPADDATLWQRLAPRIGAVHLRQRLGIEGEHEHHVFGGPGRTFFHPENWYSLHGMMRLALRATLLYRLGQRNALKIRVRHHTLALPELPAALDGMTLLQISDPHLDMHPELPAALATAVASLDYDLCVLTGDYRYRTFGPLDGVLSGMQTLRVALKGRVYGILGNHDSIRIVPACEDMGIQMLLNEHTAIEHRGATLHLAGIDDPHYFRTDNLQRSHHDLAPDQVSILLAHSPEIYRQAAHSGFSAMLCGHTHGGQICLPGGYGLYYNARCPRRLCHGPWQHQQMIGYTSSGAGSSIIDVRFNCPPEVVLHRLSRS